MNKENNIIIKYLEQLDKLLQLSKKLPSSVSELLFLAKNILTLTNTCLNKISTFVKIYDLVEANVKNIMKYSGMPEENWLEELVTEQLKTSKLQFSPMEVHFSSILCKFEGEMINEIDKYKSYLPDSILRHFSEDVAEIITNDKASIKYLRGYLIFANMTNVRPLKKGNKINPIIIESCLNTFKNNTSCNKQAIKEIQVTELEIRLFQRFNCVMTWSHANSVGFEPSIKLNQSNKRLLNFELYFWKYPYININSYVYNYVDNSNKYVSRENDILGKIIIPCLDQPLLSIERLINELGKFNKNSKEYEFILKYIILNLIKINSSLIQLVLKEFVLDSISFLISGLLENFVLTPLYKILYENIQCNNYSKKYKAIFIKYIDELWNSANYINDSFDKIIDKVITKYFEIYDIVRILTSHEFASNYESNVDYNNERYNIFNIYVNYNPVDCLWMGKYSIMGVNLNTTSYMNDNNDQKTDKYYAYLYEHSTSKNILLKQNSILEIITYKNSNDLFKRHYEKIKKFVQSQEYENDLKESMRYTLPKFEDKKIYKNYFPSNYKFNISRTTFDNPNSCITNLYSDLIEQKILNGFYYSISAFTGFKNYLIAYKNLQFPINVLNLESLPLPMRINFASESIKAIKSAQSTIEELMTIVVKYTSYLDRISCATYLENAFINNKYILPFIQDLYFAHIVNGELFKTSSLNDELTGYKLFDGPVSNKVYALEYKNSLLKECIIAINKILINNNDPETVNKMYEIYNFINEEIIRALITISAKPIKQYLLLTKLKK